MTDNADYGPFDPDRLPPVVVRYVGEHADPQRRHAVAELFTPDARVVDEGIEYSGDADIRRWLDKGASEYTFTTTPLGQRAVASGEWVVLMRLEGTFPGGVVDLRYRVTTRDDRIADLVIEV